MGLSAFPDPEAPVPLTDDPDDRPPVPEGGCWFWATDTRRWAPCDADDPRGITGEGLEHPKTL